jgi:hypothetical protein
MAQAGNINSADFFGFLGDASHLIFQELQPLPNEFDINGFDIDAFFTNLGDVKTDALVQHALYSVMSFPSKSDSLLRA